MVERNPGIHLSEEERDELLMKCDAGFKHLFGDPYVPNDKGYIVRIENRLKKLNGTVQEHSTNIQKLWMTVCLIVGALGLSVGFLGR